MIPGMRFLLLAAAAALVLTGCSDGGEPTTAPTPSASPEDAFIAQLEETVPTYIVRQDLDRFIDLGYQSCQSHADRNQTDPEIISAIARVESLEVAQAEALFWAARENFCPET
jgi:hypothetical protein